MFSRGDGAGSSPDPWGALLDVRLLVDVGHTVRSVAHLTIRVSFYLELFRETAHRRVATVLLSRAHGAVPGARGLGGPWTILIEFKVPEVTWGNVGAWAWSFFVIIILSIRVSSHPYRAGVFVGTKNIAHVAAIIAWVVYTRAWNFLLMPIFVYESLFAGTPVGGSRVGNGGDAVLSVLVDFDALPIGARAWNIVLNACIDRL